MNLEVGRVVVHAVGLQAPVRVLNGLSHTTTGTSAANAGRGAPRRTWSWRGVRRWAHGSLVHGSVPFPIGADQGAVGCCEHPAVPLSDGCPTAERWHPKTGLSSLTEDHFATQNLASDLQKLSYVLQDRRHRPVLRPTERRDARHRQTPHVGLEMGPPCPLSYGTRDIGRSQVDGARRGGGST
jgi:hypothetical protein